MPVWLQHTLVISLAFVCLALVVRQLVGTLRGGKSVLGKCCAKGCGAVEKKEEKRGERVVFIPVEMLSKRR
jgi:hypothetical protein